MLEDVRAERETPSDETFVCFDCKNTFPVKRKGATGYATLREPKDEKVCYECCGKREWADMQATGVATLYLNHTTTGLACGCSGPSQDHYRVSNWPNTLTFKVDKIKKGKHNIAGSRYDVWFTDKDGRAWHGVQVGENTQLTHCKRLVLS